jgi:arylsulfatase A-like enzyme
MREDLPVEGIEPTPKPEVTHHPNIVLVTIDTVRADRVPLYGGPAKMPNLRKLAEKGAVFVRAFSPGNVTRRSLPSIASGVSPRRMRGRVAGWALKLDPRHVLLAERFRAAGYDTAGFFCCRSQFGRVHQLGLVRGLDTVHLEYDGAALTELATTWLQERKDRERPVFLWVHYVEPHNWFKDHKPQEGARRKPQRYDLSLAAADEALGPLLGSVGLNLGEDTYLIVTSDHGEGLGDHGIKNHGATLYDTEVHVPLVVTGPGIDHKRVQQVVGLVDLAPTMLELAGFLPPEFPVMDGLSVAPELLGQREDRLGKGEAYSSQVVDRSVNSDLNAIIAGRYKLIERGKKYELYDRESDPMEKKNLVEELQEVTAALKARLARRKQIDRVPPF